MSLTTGSMKSRFIYISFILFPLFLSFVFPYLFYHQPISVFTVPVKYLRNHTLSLTAIYEALIIVLTWFSIIVVIALIPVRKTRYKHYTWSHTMSTFLTLFFLIFGCLGSYLFFFTHLSMSFSQWIRPLTLFPVVSILLSLHLLKQSTRFTFHAVLHPSFILSNLFIIIYFPLSQGTASPIFYSLLGINFGMFILKYSRYALIAAILLSFFISGFVMIVKNEVRIKIHHHSYRVAHLYHKINQKTNADKETINTNPIHLIHMDLVTSAHYSSNFLKLRTPFSNFYGKYAFNRILDRINHLGELAYIVETTPKKIAFLHGYTYRMLPFLFIPRFIWPNKPMDDNGWLYGQRYTFISNPKDKNTSWALPMPTEAWINYGWPGVIISALLIGLLLRLIWVFFIGEYPGIGNLLIAAIVVLNAAQGEADTNMAIGNAIHSLAAYWLLIKSIIYIEKIYVWIRNTKKQPIRLLS